MKGGWQSTVDTKFLMDRCFRVYVTKTQEIFEWYSSKTSRSIRWVFNYGESLAFFVEDWEKEDERIIRQIEDHVDQEVEYVLTDMQQIQNPFLCLLVMQLVTQQYDKYNSPFEIASFWDQIREARKDARILLTDCLCMETESPCARYWDLWKDEPIPLSHVRIELFPSYKLNCSVHQPVSAVIADAKSMRCMSSQMTAIEICYPENMLELYNFLKAIYLRRAVRFKRCRLCGKLFAAIDGERTEYCSRIYSGHKSCRDIGAARVYQKKILSNPITRAYNRAYKTHNARIRYGIMTKKEFQAWVAEAKQLRGACQSGEISLDRFEKWLKQ